jgi:diacylglycerol O-acyltransferase / wax synthase
VDRLSPLDASFLHIENDVNLMHIGSVGIFEGPAPSFDELRTRLEGKIPLVPRYRQRVREVPLALGRPVWVEDPHFNLDYHVRHTALPSPGGREQLRNLVSRVMSQRLDLSKPLWEWWMVEGLEDDSWALISKAHHALVDGVSGTDLLAVALEESPDVEPAAPTDWAPPPEPSQLRLVAGTVAEYAASPAEQLRAVRSWVRAPRRMASQAAFQVAGSVKGLASMSGLARPRTPSTLVGEIGPHRRYAWAATTLEDIRTIRTSLGGSVNDVVLTAVSRGYRELLLAHDEDVEGRTVRTLVPVSVRKPDERGTYNNRVSAVFAELPVGLADPMDRMAEIRSQMDRLKVSGQAVAAETLTSLSGFAPPLLLSLGTRAAFTAARRSRLTPIETVTTNVPGPQQPLYAAGRRMLTAYPYVPLASPVRVGTAIFSYDGNLTFGVTADRDDEHDVDDAGMLAAGIEAGLEELLTAARARG